MEIDINKDVVIYNCTVAVAFIFVLRFGYSSLLIRDCVSSRSNNVTDLANIVYIA